MLKKSVIFVTLIMISCMIFACSSKEQAKKETENLEMTYEEEVALFVDDLVESMNNKEFDVMIDHFSEAMLECYEYYGKLDIDIAKNEYKKKLLDSECQDFSVSSMGVCEVGGNERVYRIVLSNYYYDNNNKKYEETEFYVFKEGEKFVIADNKYLIDEIIMVAQNSYDYSSPVEEKIKNGHVHNYVEEVVLENSCISFGKKVYTCDCGKEYIKEILPIPHKYGDYVFNNDATTMKDGTKTMTCEKCGIWETVTAEGTKINYTSIYDIEITQSQYDKIINRLPSDVVRKVEMSMQGAALDKKILQCAFYNSKETEKVLNEVLGVTLAP